MRAASERQPSLYTKGRPKRNVPVWELASFFPAQGAWSEEAYLELSESKKRVELSDGFIEVLPVPTSQHQSIVANLYKALDAFVSKRHLGKVLFAPMPVHLWPGTYREPDIAFLARLRVAVQGEYWEGADLVVEVVSKLGRQRDLKTKRAEYAKAGIAEYWIVDLRDAKITVLQLSGKMYVEHGIFEAGSRASSVLLKGFSTAVTDVFED